MSAHRPAWAKAMTAERAGGPARSAPRVTFSFRTGAGARFMQRDADDDNAGNPSAGAAPKA